jgi:hypothetical protein
MSVSPDLSHIAGGFTLTELTTEQVVNSSIFTIDHYELPNQLFFWA